MKLVKFTGLKSGSRVEFGRTHVVRPKGRHLATVVWLHGLGDNGARYVITSYTPAIETTKFLNFLLKEHWKCEVKPSGSLFI